MAALYFQMFLFSVCLSVCRLVPKEHYTRSDMKIQKYSGIQVFKYSSIQVFKYLDVKYSSIPVSIPVFFSKVITYLLT